MSAIPISPRCRERIVFSERSETYCMLPAGHEGEHSMFSVPAPVDLRCTSRGGINSGAAGLRCGQPAGHIGMHSMGGMVKVTW